MVRSFVVNAANDFIFIILTRLLPFVYWPQPLDEKELERKLKKDQKVLTWINSCNVHDGTGNLVELYGLCMLSCNQCGRLVLLQAKEKEEKKLKAKQKEAARLQVVDGGSLAVT